MKSALALRTLEVDILKRLPDVSLDRDLGRHQSWTGSVTRESRPGRFVVRYNQTWRLEKLGYQTPIEAREEYELRQAA